MPLYEYTAMGRDGTEIQGSDVADNETILSEKLKRKRLILLSLKMAKLKAISMKTTTQWIMELNNLLDSGIVLEKALQIIAEDNLEKEVALLADSLRNMIKSGKSLADSMLQYGRFDSVLIPMIRAGETTGQLPLITTKLNEYYEKKNELRSEVRAALAYPLVLMFVSVLSIIGLFIYVIPTFKEIFNDNMAVLPAGTRAIFAATDWFNEYGMAASIALSLLVFFLWLGFHFLKSWKFAWDTVSLKIPIFGDLISKNNAVSFLGTLSILLHSGIPLIKALDLIKDLLSNSAQRKGLDAGINLIKQGKQFPQAMGEIPAVPRIAQRLIKVGDESGKLSESLAKATMLLEKQLRKELKSMVSLLEPVIIMLMGGAVGFIVVSMLLAVFSLTDLS